MSDTRGRRAALATVLAVFACGRQPGPPPRGAADAAGGGVAIYGAYIPAPAAPDVAALYLVVRDEDGDGDRLLSVRSDAGDAELHETREESGLVRMQPARDGLPVPAGGELRLEPGGAHGMLTRLTQPLAVGSRVHVTLEFEHAGRLALEVPVVPVDSGVGQGPPR
ncbi:MAG TPA: copper chaperone PCu(A)C [Myxococcota bacterium]|nr:copper chaperone PCu(A)C [Myxococcota bacterium]